MSGCLLAAGVVYLICRRRRQLKEQEEHRRQLNELLTSQQELNRRNETLSHELEQLSHNEIIDNVRRQLDPTLLNGEDEKRFRQSFAALYPRYLARTAEPLSGIDQIGRVILHAHLPETKYG